LSPSHFVLALWQSCVLSTVVLMNESEWIYSDILQNAPFRSLIFTIFFASSGKGHWPPNQNPADVPGCNRIAEYSTLSEGASFRTFEHINGKRRRNSYNKSALNLLRRLSTWREPHLLLSAGAAARRPQRIRSYRSTSPTHIGLSNPAGRRCYWRSMGQTDRRTDGRTPDRYMDPTPHTTWSASKRRGLSNGSCTNTNGSITSVGWQVTLCDPIMACEFP